MLKTLVFVNFLKKIHCKYFIKSLNNTTFATLFLVNTLLLYKNHLFYTFN